MAKMDVQAARRAGYTDEEIYGFMKQNNLQSKMTLGGWGENALRSTGSLVGNTVKGLVNIVNPNMEQNTIAQLGRLALGIVDSVLPGEQGNEQYAQALGQYFTQRYGSLDNIANTFYNDPAGFVDDVSLVLTAGGSAVSKLGKVGKVGKLADIGSDVARFGNLIDPVQAATRTTIGGVKQAANAMGDIQKSLGTGVEDLGRRFVTGGLGNPTKQTARTVDTMLEYPELLSRDSATAKKLYKNLGAKYGSEVGKAGNMDITKLINDLDVEISKLASSNSTAAEQKLAELLDIRNNLAARLGESGNVAAKDVWKYRLENIDPDVKKSDFGLNYADAGRSSAAKQARDIIKTNLDELNPTLTKIGRDRKTISPLIDIFEASEKRALNRQPINFSKLGLTTAGGVVAGIPGAIGGFVLETAANRPSFQAKVAKTLIPLGKKMQSAKKGTFKAPKAFSKVKTPYQASRGVRAYQRYQDSQQPQTSQYKQQREQGVLPPVRKQSKSKLSSSGATSQNIPYTPDYSKLFKKVKYN